MEFNRVLSKVMMRVNVISSLFFFGKTNQMSHWIIPSLCFVYSSSRPFFCSSLPPSKSLKHFRWGANCLSIWSLSLRDFEKMMGRKKQGRKIHFDSLTHIKIHYWFCDFPLRSSRPSGLQNTAWKRVDCRYHVSLSSMMRIAEPSLQRARAQYENQWGKKQRQKKKTSSNFHISSVSRAREGYAGGVKKFRKSSRERGDLCCAECV